MYQCCTVTHKCKNQILIHMHKLMSYHLNSLCRNIHAATHILDSQDHTELWRALILGFLRVLWSRTHARRHGGLYFLQRNNA